MARGERGVALAAMLLMALALAGLAAAVSQRMTRQMKLDGDEKHMKQAEARLITGVQDVMGQFSEDYYADHYAGELLERLAYTYRDETGSAWFSPGSLQGHRSTHTVYGRLNAASRRAYMGGYGVGRKHKGASMLVHFQSDLTKYALMVDGNLAVPNAGDLSNVVVQGGVWVRGDVDLDQGWAMSGPLAASGNVDLHGGVTGLDVHGIYTPGAVTPGGFSGFVRNVDVASLTPESMRPGAVDLAYYARRANHRLSPASGAFVFYVHPVSGQGRLNDATNDFQILEEVSGALTGAGTVVYAEGVDVVIDGGVVKGRLTICARRSPTTGVGGNVLVRGNVSYDGAANPTGNSLAVLAEGGITFQQTGPPAPLDVRGLYLAQKGAVNFQGPGGLFPFTLRGSLALGAGMAGTTSFSTVNIIYDPELDRFRPPALPEKPNLVKWKLEAGYDG